MSDRVVQARKWRRKTSLADEAYLSIRNDIISRALGSGMVITQHELMGRYGVGGTPIREALKRLEHDGLVRAIPRVGYEIVPLTISDVRETYDLRKLLECGAASRAALRWSGSQLEVIEEARDQTLSSAQAGDPSGFLEANAAFHQAVADASNNRRLASLVRRVLLFVERLPDIEEAGKEELLSLVGNHDDIVEAIAKRDAERASSAMAAHIGQGEQGTLRRLFEAGGEDILAR